MTSNRISNDVYYPSFDYLRFVLATTVAIGHSGFPTWAHSADLSVQIFFALSGWLIGGILLKSAPELIPRFYFNRAARIWIPYFVAIVLLVVASLLKESMTPKWLEFIFYKVTFVYNFFGPPQIGKFSSVMPLQGTGNHFWSICAEEQFYLIAPMLILILPWQIGKSIWFWILIALTANISAYWSYFGSIALGVLAAAIAHHKGDWHTDRKARILLAIFWVFIFAATFFGYLSYRVSAPMIAISTVWLLAKPGQHSQNAAFLGGISYPMYLNHWIGVFIANALYQKVGLKSTILCQISGVLISMLVAAGLYVLIDRVVRRHRDEYYSALRGRSVAFTGFILVTTGLVGGLLLT